MVHNDGAKNVKFIILWYIKLFLFILWWYRVQTTNSDTFLEISVYCSGAQALKKFISAWVPDKIFLVDSEIWPNLIISAKKFKIPIALINARLSKKSFNRWIKFPKTAKTIFNSFNLCLSSNLETKDFLEKLSAININNVKEKYQIYLENLYKYFASVWSCAQVYLAVQV